MSHSDQIRKGMVIQFEGQPYAVLDCTKAQTGKQKATVHVKLRSIKTGHTTERTADQLGNVEEVATETRQMQYIYPAGDDRVFMDNESYEQCTLGRDALGDAIDFLVEQEAYRFLCADGQPMVVQLPTIVVLEVADTAPVEHAGGATNVHKEATLSCGIVVQVPLFIKNGDRIRVGTEHRDYQGKEH